MCLVNLSATAIIILDDTSKAFIHRPGKFYYFHYDYGLLLC